MQNSIQDIISDVSVTFPRGDLSRYLAENRRHDKQVIVEHLNGIIEGKCPNYPTDDCKMKAYALLRLLQE